MTPFLPDCERSQHHEERSTRSDSIARRKKKRRLLPSPSTSSSAQHEQIRPLSRPALQNSQQRSQSAPDGSVASLDPHFDVEDPTRCLQGQKRKRSGADTEGQLHWHRKKRQISEVTADASNATGPAPSEDCERDDTELCPPIASPIASPVAYWAHTARWPKDFATMSQEESVSSKKRPPSSSYTQSYKDGEVPKAHSAASEKVLAGHGVHINELQGLSHVQEESKSYCKRLLQSPYPEPQYTTFPLSKFLSVWQRVQNRNEARICRDLTPLLVPSPELLLICGQQELEHVVEDIDTEWTRCKTLGGPRPKPDLAVGIAASAFGEDELAKLQNHTAFERATLFTDNLYFPFLLCEAKSADVGISVADRQNMHSSSMAVNAIVQLCRAADEAQAVNLSGRILVFSVSHDNERVKLYGHFAIIDGDKMAFYRYPIESFVLNFEENQGRKRTHDFVREIYHTFYPAHLKRIRDALAAMEDPRNVSMTSSMSIEEHESQEQDLSARSSGETEGFKRPGTPASKKQKSEMAFLREQLEQQRKDTKDLLRQLEKQRQESMAQLEQQRKESEQQQKELMKLLTEQSAQIKELLQKR